MIDYIKGFFRKVKNAIQSTDKKGNDIKNIITGIHQNYLLIGLIVAVVLF